MPLNKKSPTASLGLVFTLGVSLEDWKSLGLLSREKKIYEKHLEDGTFKKILWFTYGENDGNLNGSLHPAIEIVPKPSVFKGRLGNLIYSFLMPFLKRRSFKNLSVIKTNQVRGGWTAILASWLTSVPVAARTGYLWSVFAEKSRSPGRLGRFAPLVERFIFGAAEWVFVTTQGQKDHLIKSYSLAKEKIFVVPNYVDTELFFPFGREPSYKDRLVFVGRLHEQKNLENLLIALSGMPYGLDLYGEGPLQETLSRLADKGGVSVSFKGSRPNKDLPGILNQYPVFVLPSHYEGFPKSLVEAMACGLPVLVADVEGSRDLVTQGKNGWLAPSTEPEDLKKGLQALFQDDSLRRKLGTQARKTVEENYSLKAVAAQEKLILNF